MNMTSNELNEFRNAADKAYQVEILCELIESYPLKLEASDINTLCRLLKNLVVICMFIWVRRSINKNNYRKPIRIRQTAHSTAEEQHKSRKNYLITT